MRKLILALRALFTHGGSSAPAEQKPNVLLLLSDDHSYPFVNCYGQLYTDKPASGGLLRVRLDKATLEAILHDDTGNPVYRHTNSQSKP